MGKPSPGRRPITQDDYDQVQALHAQGLGRNAIAKQLGRSGHTISRIAAELGLDFDRRNHPQLEVATAARVVDGRARRAALAEALLADAERMRQQLFASTVVYNFGGKDNSFNERTMPEPDFRAKRDLMQAIGAAIDRALKIDAYDKIDATMSAVDAWLEAMTDIDT